MEYNEVMKFALQKGFYFPSCDIYSDKSAGFWEYGPLGVNFKNNFIDLWRSELIRRDEVLEIDGSQIMSKSVFTASGHLTNFADPIIKCKECSSTFRVDKLLMEKINININENEPLQKYDEIITKNNICCTKCNGKFFNSSRFNMMFSIGNGPENEVAYLRPETCQSIFVDFPRLFKTMRGKLPFGIAQIGKSFRNEIAPRQSILRLREFYQAEIEIFCNPNNFNSFTKFSQVANTTIRLYVDNKTKTMSCKEAVDSKIIPNIFIAYYIGLLTEFYAKTGIDMSKTRFRKLSDDEKAFYSTSSFDFEVKTAVGWLELVACNYRTNYDLIHHANVSKENYYVLDGEDKIMPHVFEISMGIDRSLYSILEHSLKNDSGNKRTLLALQPYLSPIYVGVLSLLKKDGLEEKTNEIYTQIKKKFTVFLDHAGTIGRRYRRLDEIGAPFAITIDYQTLKDQTVTMRMRDNMNQIRIQISEIEKFLTTNILIPHNAIKSKYPR